MQDLTIILEKDRRVKFACLFGSAVREEQNNLSDIDIAVYLREDCDPAEAKLDIIGKLMERLGRGRFGLVILNTAPLPLAARVIRCRKILADRDPFSRHRYESRILREYFDFSVLEESILNRRNLYPLQDGVLRIVQGLALPFYLTGGTALSRHYFAHRHSKIPEV